MADLTYGQLAMQEAERELRSCLGAWGLHDAARAARRYTKSRSRRLGARGLVQAALAGVLGEATGATYRGARLRDKRVERAQLLLHTAAVSEYRDVVPF